MLLGNSPPLSPLQKLSRFSTVVETILSIASLVKKAWCARRVAESARGRSENYLAPT